MIGDGMSDYPLPELNNHTPLEVAKKPNMDKLAEKGRSGLTINAPKDLPVGSDVANMSIFGYDPHKYYTGRGPIEAANQGIETVDGDVVFRCNLITEKDGKVSGVKVKIEGETKTFLLKQSLLQQVDSVQIRK